MPPGPDAASALTVAAAPYSPGAAASARPPVPATTATAPAPTSHHRSPARLGLTTLPANSKALWALWPSGLVTAGALTSTGMGAIAGGLARAASVEAVESLVVFQLALCKLREQEALDHEDDVWLLLTQLEREVVRELVRVVPFSDDDASSVKVLNRKLRAIQRALDCITDKAWTSRAVHTDEPIPLSGDLRLPPS